jgi:hypothetical protein
VAFAVNDDHDMSQRLHLDDDGLTVELAGLLALGALHRRVHVPWTAMAEVRPDALAVRRGRHGRFVHRRLVSFLSFDDPRRVVRIRVDRRAPGAPAFDEVVVGHAAPAWLTRQIARRVTAASAAVSAPALAA